AKREEARKFLDTQYELLTETARQRVADYLIRIATTKPDPSESSIYFLSLAPEDLRPPLINRWRRYLEERATPDDPVFAPWHALFQIPEAQLQERGPELLAELLRRPAGVMPGELNPLVRTVLETATLRTREEIAKAYGDLLRAHYEQSKSQPSDDAAVRQLLEIMTDRASPGYFPKSQTRRHMSRQETDAFGGKLTELDRLTVQDPHAPPRAMVLNDASQPHDPRVFVRGNPSQPGPRVPRQFLSMIAGANRQPFVQGSGRLELANAIVDRSNPLPSRVIVNRWWMHYFGEPLVSTPSDFGLRSSPPVMPELLDELARELMAGDWSQKRIHRRLVLSAAYQQSSADRADARDIDPENHYWWRANRRRLDMEAMRDAMLAISGRLDQRMGGRPVDVVGNPALGRRTVYAMIDRQSVPAMFRAFDFPIPDQSIERRPQTTVPQQALFALNSPFLVEQARTLARRSIEFADGSLTTKNTKGTKEYEEVLSSLRAPRVLDGPKLMAASFHAARADEQSVRVARIAALYRFVYQRLPGEEEVRAASAFLEAGERASEKSPLTPLEQLAQVLLISNEAMFVD
ncbi:MAG: hypothetical protein RIS70_2730, partial [Planctomycetota bacterium]